MQFLEREHPLHFKIRALEAMGCYPVRVNLPSLITFQEMNNVVHEEQNTLQDLGIPMTVIEVILCFNGDKKKINFNISSGVKTNMTELEAPTNKYFQTLSLLKTIVPSYHHEVKNLVILAIFIVVVDYGFKQEELYFQLFTLADNLNLGIFLKFKQEAGQFVVAGYVLSHPAAFSKMVLNANESVTLERTLKMLAFIECGEEDPEMATLVGDYLEDFFKLVRDYLFFPLNIGTSKVAGLLLIRV